MSFLEPIQDELWRYLQRVRHNGHMTLAPWRDSSQIQGIIYTYLRTRDCMY